MRIAISATGSSLDAAMDDRFGRCPCFVITDTEGASHDTIENVHASRGSGAGIQAACMLIERGVAVVLTGRCGPNACETLDAAGVRIITGCSGSVRQAVEWFAAQGDEPLVGGDPVPPAQRNTAGAGKGMGRGSGRGLGGGSGRGRRRAMNVAETPKT